MQAKEPLHEAAKHGDLEQVRQLLAEGLAVDGQSEAGYTPLQYAVANKHLKVVRLLVKAGADVNATAGNGWPVLHFGVFGGGLQIMKLLLRAGAPVDLPDTEGSSPLQKAVEDITCPTDLIGHLIEGGADVNRQMPGGGSILNAAVLSGRTEVVGLLLGAAAKALPEEEAGWDISPGSVIMVRTRDWLGMKALLTEYLGKPPPSSLRDAFASILGDGPSED